MDWINIVDWGTFLGGAIFGLFLGYLFALRTIRRPPDSDQRTQAGVGERKEPPDCP